MQRRSSTFRAGAPAFTLAVTLAALLTGCGFTEEKNRATALLERYFTAASTSDAAGLLAFYSEEFFAATSRGEFTRLLENIGARCGQRRTHRLANWNVTTRVGSHAGSTTVLTYDVEYARCQVTETITVFRPPDAEPKILGHHFQFLREDGLAPDKTATTA